MEQITITMLEENIKRFQKAYDELQPKFRLPNADFEQLGIIEDLLSDYISDLCKFRDEIMYEQTKDNDYTPLYCR